MEISSENAPNGQAAVFDLDERIGLFSPFENAPPQIASEKPTSHYKSGSMSDLAI
jgi:hypothetical protein